MMNPRTHTRGAPPDFTLPKPNPNPERMTDALWWLVCMREMLEPELSDNGGTVAAKPGYHSWGSRLPATDHSIRRQPDRSGPWWRDFTSAHDWTFRDAQRGDYRTISKYSRRLYDAMRDPKDTRPDDVYAYFIGQIDGDPVVEGYNEYDDENETGDDSHLWHRHDSIRRSAVGLFWQMWKALTIDMGWTHAEWLRSTLPKEIVNVTNPTPAQIAAHDIDHTANSQSWGGATLTTLVRTGYLANVWAPHVENLIEELNVRVEDADDDLDAIGASLLLITALLSKTGEDPAGGENVWYNVMRRAVADELDARAVPATEG
jgi:hypothetical protein